MNIYLMELLSKWISVATLAIASLFGVPEANENHSLTIENINKTKNSQAETESIPYEVEKLYNSEVPKGTEKVLEKGISGVAYIINGERQVIKEPVTEKIEIGTKETAVFTGKMTGYGADCAGCSGYGTLSCRTRNGSSFSLIRDGYTYNDSEYGTVRILAAALEKFPCGTIIKVDHSVFGSFNAIVLDTGGAMKAAWNNGVVHMDLAYVTQSDSRIHLTTTNRAKYTVQRWGW